MYKHAGNPSILEMEYQDEVGTGLGPTLEFYANTSKEFARRRIHMWRENDASSGDEEFLHVLNGFFPAPLPDGKSVEEERILYLFGGLGRFVARSMLDSRIIDIHFNPLFFRLAEKEELDQPSILSLRAVDKRLFDSLKLLQRFADERSRIQGDKSLSSLDKSRRIKRIHIKETTVEDLALDFTLPGYSQIELKVALHFDQISDV
jgi:E3 ubiquitin-protein ligase TRIP12